MSIRITADVKNIKVDPLQNFQPFNLDLVKTGALCVSRNGEIFKFIAHIPESRDDEFRLMMFRMRDCVPRAYMDDGRYCNAGISENDLSMAPLAMMSDGQFIHHGTSLIYNLPVTGPVVCQAIYPNQYMARLNSSFNPAGTIVVTTDIFVPGVFEFNSLSILCAPLADITIYQAPAKKKYQVLRNRKTQELTLLEFGTKFDIAEYEVVRTIKNDKGLLTITL